MSLADWFRRNFLAVETEARTIEQSIVHFAEKELAMFDTKVISDALDRLKARPDQSATITALQGQVNDLTGQLTAANADITELVGDLTQIQTVLLALAPDPTAPAQ